MNRKKSLLTLIPILSLLFSLSLTPFAQATAILDSRMLPTEAELHFSGKASVSNSISVSQDIQIKPLTADFGAAPLSLGTQGAPQPIRWSVSFEDPTGKSIASVSMDYLQNGSTSFSYRQIQPDDTKSSNPLVDCKTPFRECVITLSNWNIADPLRVSFGSDQLQGKNWWRATVMDLANGTLIDLGSIKDLSLNSIPNLVVSDGVSRNSVATDCPGDLAPVADTYFGPIVDSSGVEDLYPDKKLVTHDCANAKFGDSYSYTGAFLLYGGSQADQTSAPREYSFTPSVLIPSALTPIPDAPSNFAYTAAGGVLHIFVDLPNFTQQQIKKVFLVSPELGYQKSAPLYSKSLGSSTQFTITISKQFIGKSIHLSFFAQSISDTSNPYVEVITIPDSAFDTPTPSSTPLPQKSPVPTKKPTTKATSKATAKPTTKATKKPLPKPSAKPTIADAPAATVAPSQNPNATGPVPNAIENLSITVVKGLLIFRGESNQNDGVPVTGCLLVAPFFNGNSTSPIVGDRGQVRGNEVIFAIQLNSTYEGVTFKYSMSLYNDAGVSSAVSGTFTLPSVISYK